MSSRIAARAGADPPSTPTRSLDDSEELHVRRSPRSKEVRTPYYLPLSEHPINATSPARMGSLPAPHSPSPSRVSKQVQPASSPFSKQARPAQSVDSQATGGRQRRTTAAAALLRIQGKMKPPAVCLGSIAEVSAALSALESESEQLAVVSTADGGSTESSRTRQVKSGAKKAPSVQQPPSTAQPAKKRKAKELVQAVVKAQQPSAAPAAHAPQRGRAAVKHKQDAARAAAVGGKLVPAAVPAMQESMVSRSRSKKKARTTPSNVEDPFPCGADAWEESEVQKLHYVCTHKVPPNSLRYWQQVAMHMPGRTVTDCYEKFNESHGAPPKNKGRAAAAPRAAPLSAPKSVGEAAPKTECQKRKFIRQVRWQVQQSQQNDSEQLQVMMRKQQAADACIDALQRKRTHAKTPASVGTILKAPKSFQALAALNEEGSKDRAEPGSVTPKAKTRARRNRVSELPDVNAALQVVNKFEEAMLESPDPDFYHSDGVSE